MSPGNNTLSNYNKRFSELLESTRVFLCDWGFISLVFGNCAGELIPVWDLHH